MSPQGWERAPGVLQMSPSQKQCPLCSQWYSVSRIRDVINTFCCCTTQSVPCNVTQGHATIQWGRPSRGYRQGNWVGVELKYHRLTSATFWLEWVDGRWFHLLRWTSYDSSDWPEDPNFSFLPLELTGAEACMLLFISICICFGPTHWSLLQAYVMLRLGDASENKTQCQLFLWTDSGRRTGGNE